MKKGLSTSLVAVPSWRSAKPTFATGTLQRSANLSLGYSVKQNLFAEVKLETLKPGISLVGIEPTLIASVIAVVPIADGAVQVPYKTPEGTIKDRLLSRVRLTT